MQDLTYADIVRTDRDGQHVIYSIVDRRFLEGVSLIRDAMLEMTRRQAQQAASFSELSLSENQED